METLAMTGGSRAVPEGAVKAWPEITERDRTFVLASLAGGNHANGPNCKALEKEFAAWQGAKHALTVNSGTAALHMALFACDVGAGDEVLVPSYTWPSSATCVLHHNAIPVFVDIRFDTMNLDEDKLEAAVSPKTRAIMAVHLHGLPLDMDKIMAVARRRGLKVVEDCCQAQGATWKGRKVGSFGDAAAFSFNQNKVVCSGEGGMMTTDDEAAAAKADRLRYFGEHDAPGGPDRHDYALGWMYRNNDLTAAFGRSQLEQADRNLASMRTNAERFAAYLRGTPGLILPEETPAGARHNWYNYTIRFDMKTLGHEADAAEFRDRLLKAMWAEGVQTSVWQNFILPAMTVFRAKNAYGHGCPWACGFARPVEYRPEDYPEAQRHCDTHTGFTFVLRHPNGEKEVELTAKGVRKVVEQADRVP